MKCDICAKREATQKIDVCDCCHNDIVPPEIVGALDED